MGKSRVFRNVLVYLFLFLLSFMVFDSATLMIGVFVALIALYHFTHKLARRNQL
jgi:predicted membrane chloride channel (bestrophin family)